jgi:hypothetical protein
MPIKIRAIHTGKLGYTANRYPATATHTGAINHYRVQADNSFNSKRLCGFGTKFHHNTWTNSNDSVNLLITFK